MTGPSNEISGGANSHLHKISIQPVLTFLHTLIPHSSVPESQDDEATRELSQEFTVSGFFLVFIS